jgi:hypothetical protein
MNEARIRQIINNPDTALNDEIQKLAISTLDFKHLLIWLTNNCSVEQINQATTYVIEKRKVE